MAFDTPDAHANEIDLAVSDLGPLAWVLDELRKSLEGATKAIRRFVRDADAARGADLASIDTSPLRIARQQVHTSVGALDMVGMAGPAALLRAMEQAVQKFVSQPELCTEEEAGKVERGSFALIQFLEATVAGRVVSAVTLFPQHKAIAEFLGAERIHPADLWEFDGRAQQVALNFQVQALEPSPVLRGELDKAVLQVVKTLDKVASTALRDRFLGLHAGAGSSTESGVSLSTLWAVSAGFFDALSQGLLAADMFVKRMPSRILSAYGLVAKGEAAPAELLLRDLLFFCGQAGNPAAESGVVLRAVRQAFGLARFRTSDYARGQFGHFDPAVLAQARKRVAAARDLWSNLAGGDTAKVKATSDQFGLVADSLVKLHAQSAPLAQELVRAVQTTVDAGRAPSAELAMEVATSVLYLEAAFEDLDPNDAGLAERTAKLAHRLEKVRGGSVNEPLEPWIEDLYRKVSDRQTMGSVVGELRVSLNELERVLDQFFRDPSNKQVLRAVPDQLAQMRGVLTVLGLSDASSAVMRMRSTVEEILVNELDAVRAREAGTFDKLGNNLGALGFLIDMLGYQPSFAKKLFSYDPETGELRPLMGRTSVATRLPDAGAAEPIVVHTSELTFAKSPEPTAAMAMASAGVGAMAAGAAVAVTVAPTGPVDDADFGDDDLRDIFLEEAREVVTNAGEALVALQTDPSNLADQTTLRRAFHTLKGSSRMVGLNDFGEAAWSMEQVFNAWLSDHRAAPPKLLALTREAIAYLGAWVEGIGIDNVAAFSTPLVRASADAFRLSDTHVHLPMPDAPLVAATGQPVAEIVPALVLDSVAVPVLPPQPAAMPALEFEAVPEALPQGPTEPPAVAVLAPIALAPLEIDGFSLDLDEQSALPAASDAPGAQVLESAEPAASFAVEHVELLVAELVPEPTPVMAEPLVMPQSALVDELDLDLLFEAEVSAATPPVVDQSLAEQAVQHPLIDAPRDFSSSEVAALELFELPDEAPAAQADAGVVDVDAFSEPKTAAPIEFVAAPNSSLLAQQVTADVVDLDDALLAEFGLEALPPPVEVDVAVPQNVAPAAQPASLGLDPSLYGLNHVSLAGAVAVGAGAFAAVAPAAPREFASTQLGVDSAASAAPADAMDNASLNLDDFELGELPQTEAVPQVAPIGAAALTDVDGAIDPLAIDLHDLEAVGSTLAPLEESTQEARSLAALVTAAAATVAVTEAAASSAVASPSSATPSASQPTTQPTFALASDMGDDQIKVIGPLRIGIPLYNVYLNEADEWSRRLQDDLGVWQVDSHSTLPPAAIALAHSLAGSSATVGFIGLSEVSRALEHSLERAAAVSPQSAHASGSLFIDAAQDIRRLLHQFAAGFLKEPRAGLVNQLKGFVPLAEPETSSIIDLFSDSSPTPLPHDVSEPVLADSEAALTAADPEPMEVEALNETPALSLVAPAAADTAPIVAEAEAETEAVELGWRDEAAEAALAARAAEPVEYATPSDPAETIELIEVAPPEGVSAAINPVIAVAAVALTAGAVSSVQPSVAVEPAALESTSVAPESILAPAVDVAPRQTAAVTLATTGTNEVSAQDIDDDIDVQDAVDVDLFPIFEEEAMELLPLLSGALRQWHARADNQSARSEVLRALHTIKGSARLAGALRLGEMAHLMESQIERFNGPYPAEIEPLLAEFDHMQGAFDVLRSRDHKAYALFAQLPSIEPEAQSVAPSNDVAAAVVPSPLARPTAFSAPASSAGAGHTVRVRSQLLDRMLNQAGEIMITRSRVEAELSQLRGSLSDLTANLERMRQQLREIELQAETQMQSRQQLAKTADVSFDPLEFDRFTRFQEITRSMAESVNDVATVQRNITRAVEATEDDLAAQTRQTRDLQRDLLKTRMVEFEGISERLYRVVRQAGKDTSKQVKLDILGGSIELDRGVLDRMTPAFEHLLRNCVAHGIEAADERTAAGKDASGNIVIGLHQEGNEVAVEFSDDGRGLNLSKIKAKAVAQGLMEADAAIDDQQAAALIFMPGFSTADQVSELSGRGIGMDVVRNEVQALGGRVETRSSAGKGTTFKMILPLTTAVTQVVMIRAGKLMVGTPSNVVEVVRRANAKELQTAYETGSYEFAGEQVPFFWAGALLQHSQRSVEPPTRSTPVVVFRSAQQRVAVHVDEVLGNQEVVVKNLGQQLARLPGLAGMSVLASGAVVLIYNPVALSSVYGDEARNLASNAVLDPLAKAAEPVVVEVANDDAAIALAEAQAAAALDPNQTLHGFAVPKAVRPKAEVPLVMVVDDSITVRRVTQRLLAREGYRVVLAADGLQALEKLQDEIPAVVLSDIEMPRMDGFDLARNIRMDNDFFNIPIIMITSRIAEKHKEHAAELGVNHYLGKPYAEDELLALVRSYCFDEVLAGAGN